MSDISQRKARQLSPGTKMMSIRMEEERIALIDTWAKAAGLTRAGYLRACLDAVSEEQISEMVGSVHMLIERLEQVFDTLYPLGTAFAVHSAISLQSIDTFVEAADEDALREFQEEADRFKELAELTLPALAEAVGALRTARLVLERW